MGDQLLDELTEGIHFRRRPGLAGCFDQDWLCEVRVLTHCPGEYIGSTFGILKGFFKERRWPTGTWRLASSARNSAATSTSSRRLSLRSIRIFWPAQNLAFWRFISCAVITTGMTDVPKELEVPAFYRPCSRKSFP